MSHEIHEKIGLLFNEIAMLKGRLERTMRHGTIAKQEDIDLSDPEKPRIRLTIGKKADGSPLPSPWVPFSTMAGARNQHNPPSVGQQFTLLSPDGDMEQAVAVPLGHSKKIKAPSTDPKAFVDEIGKTRNTQTDGTWKQEIEKASIDLRDNKVVITAGNTVVTFEDGKVTFDTKAVKLGKNADKGVSIQGTADTGGYVDSGPFSAILTSE